MGRIRRSIRILGISLGVLRRDKELLLLPVLAGLGVVVAVTGVGWLYAALRLNGSLLTLAAFLLIPFAGASVATFINASIVAAASIRLSGGDPTLADGLRTAIRRAGPIARWAFYSVTIGTLIRMTGSVAGRFGMAVANLAWGAATYFVVPVIVVEGLPHPAALRRSFEISRTRFGDALIGAGVVGAAFVPPLILLWAVLLLFEPISTTFAVDFGLAATAVVLIVGPALSGIFQAALYAYAVTGAAGPFTAEDLRGTFRTRGS